MKQKGRKSIGNILSSIGESGSVLAEITGVAAVVVMTIASISSFPGESIKIPKDATVSQIAAQHGTSQERLGKINKLEDPNYIQAGKDLILYPKGSFGFFQKAYDTVDNWF